MSYKIRISKAGYNVLTETDVNNIVYDSDYDTLKYYASGTATFDVGSSSNEGSADVTHGLGYKPFFIVFMQLNNSEGSSYWTSVPSNFYTTVPITVATTVTAAADSTKLYFVMKTTAPEIGEDKTFNFRYKIFRNDTGL